MDEGGGSAVAQLLEDISDASWKGHIPIEICVSEKDLSSLTPPAACFVFAPRHSYLPAIAADVIDHLRSFAIELVPKVWFECDGVPLKTHLPVGVLFDLYCPPPVGRSPLRLVWKITVRYRDFPADQLLQCCTREGAETLYLHSLKQALHSLHGSTRAFNSITGDDQRMLWESCNACSSRDGFETAGAHGLRPATAELARSVPVRLLFVGATPQHVLTVQKPVRAVDPARARATTLRDVILGAAPSAANATASEPLVQGVYVPLDCPIFELWHALASADLYLYVVVCHS